MSTYLYAPLSLAEDAHCLFPQGLLRHDIPKAKGDELVMLADKSEGKQGGKFQFKGNVKLVRKEQYIEADKAEYEAANQELTAQGHIHLQTQQLVIKGEEAKLNFVKDQGKIRGSQYYFLNQGFRGTAEEFRYSRELVELTGATYTTCDDGASQWQLKAGTLRLNEKENEGTATNVSLQVASLPVFYFPYISFPLKGRKSGFLPPSFGTSRTNGVDVKLPYYLNIAPNMDTTLIPRYIEKRGAQLGAETRYLAHTHRGDVSAEYLPDDDLSKGDRHFYQYKQFAEFTPYTSMEGRYAATSDVDYFRDLGTSLNTASQTNLERKLLVSTHGRHWSASGLVQSYQLVIPNASSADHPYRQEPQLGARYQDNIGAFYYGLSGQYTRFVHPSRLSGQRVLLQPQIEYRAQKAFGFSKSSLLMHSLRYETEDHTRTFASGTHIPSFLWDNGLNFDRYENDKLFTLEPRLTYLHTPYVEQAHLPLFDSGLLDPNIFQLFQRQRYSGADRFADDNRITLALTSRMIDTKQGDERSRITLAHSLHLSDQRVQLPAEARFSRGDYLSALSGQLKSGRWTRLLANAFYDSRYYGSAEKLAFELHHDRSIYAFNMAYRVRRDGLEQISLAGYLSVSEAWKVTAGGSYALDREQSPESVAGIEYNGCCLRVRFLAREYRLDENAEPNTSFLVQLEFKGLSTVGQRIDDRFFKDIQGYREIN
ncbi:MAG: LPS assembly protein LptD [Gammaproteobacteria bacterium]|nr:LPS assembly protein LptD [Gammaproteobacteria bacterium]